MHLNWSLAFLFSWSVASSGNVYAITNKTSSVDSSASISMVGPIEDQSRSEVTMALLGGSYSIPETFKTPTKRSIAFQIYKPTHSLGQKLPIVLFSGGLGEDFRFYSTVLSKISLNGYLVVNIDHYYYQNSASHSDGYDEWVQNKRKEMESMGESEKQERFMKTKKEGLQVYYQDILFTLNHLPEVIKNDSIADLNTIFLMGHSLGGNADKKVIEELYSIKDWKRKLKGFVSLDSRLNQLELKTDFEIPTLVLGAQTGYEKDDSLRKLPSQKNLKLKILEHTTHVSFNDFSIFYVLGKSLEALKVGLNLYATRALENDIQKMQSKDTVRFGEPLFLGNKEQMEAFLATMEKEIVQFFVFNTK
jgi:hypothetical protein